MYVCTYNVVVRTHRLLVAGESSILLTYMYLVVMLLVKSIPKKSVLASVIVYKIFPSLEQEDQWVPQCRTRKDLAVEMTIGTK